MSRRLSRLEIDLCKAEVQSSEYEIRNDSMDKGIYAWFVCLATAWCFGVNGGMATNYPLIYNKLVEVYNNTPNYEVYTGSCS